MNLLTGVIRTGRVYRLAVVIAAGSAVTDGVHAQAPIYDAGEPWGTVAIPALKEASGLAASWRNTGVLWTHNDGGKRKIYGVSPAGLHAATFDIRESAGDIEEIAVGPGPVEDVSYLYIGDIGGNSAPGDLRNSVRILRVPEPPADPAVVTSPPSSSPGPATVFTLIYPDGSYDAEAMFVDPVNADLYLFSKTAGQSRVYRANLNGLAGGSSVALTYLSTVAVSEPSAAAISRDGAQIILRNENAAYLWNRSAGATVAATLAGAPRATPVIGTPAEPNGEAITFLTDGSGYMTLSEGDAPVLYHFQAQIPMAPAIQSPIPSRSVFTGESVSFPVTVSGYPQPAFTWRFQGAVLPGQTSDTLNLTNVTPAQGGEYEVTATNSAGSAGTRVTLTVRPRPVLRVTEVQSSASAANGADWWELTNFEAEPVDLSGWRFNDDGGGLDNAFVFPPGLTIAPGESIIFVDSLTPAQFRAWWGPGVPAETQIITFTGSGLALGNGGDTVRLWDDSTTNENETIAVQVFGAATAGLSFNYSPAGNVFGALSQVGVNGVFRSAAATDTGSPGVWLPPAIAASLNAVLGPATLRLEFQTSPYHWYTLEEADDLGTGPWTPRPPFQAAVEGPQTLEFPVTGNSRFFRLRIR